MGPALVTHCVKGTTNKKFCEFLNCYLKENIIFNFDMHWTMDINLTESLNYMLCKYTHIF